jgi:hypothetical protein
VIKSKAAKLAGPAAVMRIVENMLRILVVKSLKEKPIGRQRHSWEYNIKLYDIEMVFTLAEDRIL